MNAFINQRSEQRKKFDNLDNHIWSLLPLISLQVTEVNATLP